ncbi:alkaline phosphatase [Candidatus Cyanaurora vandensis]|uniref:alkaline phosphatase n=1 Tax=Candidatus Cyanaurora vandensis TaxID=2714958 RepID=UPI00257AB727|nr:alkaline phosphatase [Candidatus Cyanaurora vandensis]
MTRFWLNRLTLLLSATLVLTAPAVQAGPDDDARFKGDGVTRNNLDPIQSGGLLADFVTNAEPTTGLRIMPPTNTQILVGQLADLRIETQIPGATPPVLKQLVINTQDRTQFFNATVAAQGTGLESGNPASSLLYGATARNLSFSTPGLYDVTAVVTVDGVDYTITNTYQVSGFALGGKVQHLVFFLGDAMGLPVRSAARFAGRGLFEGRSRSRLNMDQMESVGLVGTASYDSLITDSAPGMANYVTGLKQPNNGLNVSADNTPETVLDNPRIETLWEFLKRTQGWKIGVVTDAFVTDATPAAVASHTRSRGTRTAIAQQYLDFYQDGTAQPLTGYTSLQQLTQPVDVILGSGASDWLLSTNPEIKTFYQYGSGGRTDVDLFANIAPSLGYSTVRNLSELNAAPNNQPLLGIFTGEFRTTSSGLGVDNIPGTLDRLVARGKATIGGQTASNPALGMTVAPPQGTGCGTLIQDCFAAVPSKTEMTSKAIQVLNTLAGPSGGWALLVEQSQSDKLAHTLEYERVIYEILELDNAIGFVMNGQAQDGKTLSLATADHAQPETIVGVVVPSAIAAGGATPAGGCFTPSTTYPITIGSAADTTRPCPLQDAIGTFNDGTFPTYQDLNNDGFPDEADPTIKLVLENGGRPTYSQNYLTNFQPLSPSGSNASFPNPARDPDGILLVGNMPTRNVLPAQPAPGAPISSASANKTNGNTGVAPHSGEDVPLSASGPGAGLFAGSYENTDVHIRLGQALSGKATLSSLKQGSPFLAVPNVKPDASAVKGFKTKS